jgi:formate hydrogenlyase subunit 4
MVKLTLFITIAWSAFLPWGIATQVTVPDIAVGVVIFLAKLLALAIVIAIIESTMAKLRLFRLPNLLTGAFILAFLAVMLYFVL